MFAHFMESQTRLTGREESIMTWGWGITSPEAITRIAQEGPVIEVGSGTGWWASRLAASGVDVIATDIHIPGEIGSLWPNSSLYHPILRMAASEAAAAHPNRALLMVWPPYNEAMARQALEAYKGTTLIYVGEEDGGCTADEMFFTSLRNHWIRVDRVEIPRWFGLHDRMEIFHVQSPEDA